MNFQFFMELHPLQSVMGGYGLKSVIGVLAHSQVINFHNKLKMSSLHCQCADEMVASCELPNSDWGTLLFCIGAIVFMIRHLRDEESEDDASESPPTMYS